MNTSPPPTVPANRRGEAGRIWFTLGLLALFAVVSIQYSVKVLHNRGAFTRWGDHILHSVDGAGDAAEAYNYPNPPIMAIVLYPMAVLPSPWGALTWFYLKVALTLLALRWVFRLVETPDRPFPMWARAAAVLLSLGPIIGDLHHGNINLFILFLVVASLAAFQRRRDLSSGLLLGLAVACKLTPALFLPFFLWKRQWRVLAGAAAGLLLFLWPGFVPAAVLGWDANQKQINGWYAEMVRPFVIEGKITSEHNNQSLPGLVSRLAAHNPSFTTYIKDEKTGQDVQTPTEYDNVLNLSLDQVRWLVKGCMALFALAVVWRCRTPTQPRVGWRLSAEYSWILIGMLLFSERTWKHHCVTLVLPFAVVCYFLATQRAGWWVRGGLVAALTAAALLMLSTSSGLLGDDAAKANDVSNLFGKQMEVYGAYLWAWVILGAALLALVRRRDTPAAAVNETAGANPPAAPKLAKAS
jgi:hypothetical protein